MKETAKTGRINIGTASIVLILLILCLAVFSLLSPRRPCPLPDGVQNRCRPSIRLTRRLRPGLTVSGE